MFAAVLTTILFSLSAICGRRASRWLGATEANFVRLLFPTALMAVWAHGWGAGWGGGAFLWMFVSGCVGFGIGDLALFQAYARISVRLTLLLVQCLAAPVAALVEWVWLGTTLTPVQILCSAVILLGVGIALSPEEQQNVPRRPFILGVAFGTIAAFCQGLGAVISRKAYDVMTAASLPHIDGVSAAYQRILGGVLVSGLFLLYLRTLSPASLDPAKRAPGRWQLAWPWLIGTGVAGPFLGVSCYQWALSTTPTGIVLPIVALTPLVVLPFSKLIENERITARAVAGGIIAVAGVVGLKLLGTHS
jgi:drug/metabolite transporter (DMT)-like permease